MLYGPQAWLVQVPHVLRASCSLVPYVLCVVHALLSQVICVLRALVHYVLHALRVFMSRRLHYSLCTCLSFCVLVFPFLINFFIPLSFYLEMYYSYSMSVTLSSGGQHEPTRYFQRYNYATNPNSQHFNSISMHVMIK